MKFKKKHPEDKRKSPNQEEARELRFLKALDRGVTKKTVAKHPKPNRAQRRHAELHPLKGRPFGLHCKTKVMDGKTVIRAKGCFGGNRLYSIDTLKKKKKGKDGKYHMEVREMMVPYHGKISWITRPAIAQNAKPVKRFRPAETAKRRR